MRLNTKLMAKLTSKISEMEFSKYSRLKEASFYAINLNGLFEMKLCPVYRFFIDIYTEKVCVVTLIIQLFHMFKDTPLPSEGIQKKK